MWPLTSPPSKMLSSRILRLRCECPVFHMTGMPPWRRMSSTSDCDDFTSNTIFSPGRRARSSRASRLRIRVAAFGHRAEALDLVLGQRRRARMDHLDAVVLDGVVASGDVGAAVELPVRGREVEDGRGHQTHVDHVDPPRAHAVDEAGLEILRGEPIVLTDGDAPTAVAADQRRVGAPDLTEHVGVDVRADETADVVRAKHVRVQHCAVPWATIL